MLSVLFPNASEASEKKISLFCESGCVAPFSWNMCIVMRNRWKFALLNDYGSYLNNDQKAQMYPENMQ